MNGFNSKAGFRPVYECVGVVQPLPIYVSMGGAAGCRGAGVGARGADAGSVGSKGLSVWAAVRSGRMRGTIK